MVVILANSIKQSVLRKDFFSTPVLGPPLKLFTQDEKKIFRLLLRCTIIIIKIVLTQDLFKSAPGSVVATPCPTTSPQI
jgi:hypothetical protein